MSGYQNEPSVHKIPLSTLLMINFFTCGHYVAANNFRGGVGNIQPRVWEAALSFLLDNTEHRIRGMFSYMQVYKQKTTSSHYGPCLRKLIRMKRMGKHQRMLQLSRKSSNTPRIAWSCNLELADQPLWWDSKDILPLLAGEQVHQCSLFQMDCPSTQTQKTILDVHPGKLMIFSAS